MTIISFILGIVCGAIIGTIFGFTLEEKWRDDDFYEDEDTEDES